MRGHTGVGDVHDPAGDTSHTVAAGTAVPIAARANLAARNAGAAHQRGPSNATTGTQVTQPTQPRNDYPAGVTYGQQTSANYGANDARTNGSSEYSTPLNGADRSNSASVYSAQETGSFKTRSVTSVGNAAGQRDQAAETSQQSGQNAAGQPVDQNQSNMTANGSEQQDGRAQGKQGPTISQRADQQTKRTKKVMNNIETDHDEAVRENSKVAEEDKKSTTDSSSQFDFGVEPSSQRASETVSPEGRERQARIARELGVSLPTAAVPSPKIGTSYQRTFGDSAGGIGAAPGYGNQGMPGSLVPPSPTEEPLPTKTPGSGPATFFHRRSLSLRSRTSVSERTAPEEQPALPRSPQPARAQNPETVQAAGIPANSARSPLAIEPAVDVGRVPKKYQQTDQDLNIPMDAPGLYIKQRQTDAQVEQFKEVDGARTEALENRKKAKADVSQDIDSKVAQEKLGTNESRLEKNRQMASEYVGWRQVGGWNAGTKESGVARTDLLTRATLLDEYISDKYLGDWYQNTALIILTAFAAWVIGRWHGSISWLSLILMFSATAYRTSIRRVRRNARDDVIREASMAKLDQGKESMEWLNSFLVKFWIIYEPSLCEMITQIANDILKDQTPPMVESLKLDKFTLGNKAPRLEFVSTTPTTDPTVVILDYSASFTPNDNTDLTSRQLKTKTNPKVQLGVRIGKGIISKNLPILVEDMSFTGTLTFRIKLMERFPHIKTLDVWFNKRPDFDFVLKPIGGDTFGFDINIIPGLAQFIKEMVHANLGPMFYAPNKFQLNIEQMMAGVGVMTGVGVLSVTIVSASDLRPGAVSKKVDPYVAVLNVNNAELDRTKIKEDTRSPVWKETLPVIITNPNEMVILSVRDFNGKHVDRAIGTVSLPLSTILDSQGDDLVTSPILSGGRESGQLTYSVHYSSVHMPQTNDDGTTTSGRDTKSGILALQILGARNLDSSVSVLGEVSSYCELEINGRPEETTKVVKSNNDPDWQFNKEIIVLNKPGTQVVFRVRHSRSKGKGSPQIGSLKLRLTDLLLQNQKGRAWFPLADDRGDLHIQTQWKSCAIAGIPGSSYVEPIGVLRFFLRCANNLRNLEKVGKVDPYIRISINGVEVERSAYIKGTLDPEWNEALYIPIQNEMQVLSVECMDTESKQRDRSLGSFEVDLQEIIQRNSEDKYKYFVSDKELTNKLVMPDRGPKGSVTYSVEFYPAIDIVNPFELEHIEAERKKLKELQDKKEPDEEQVEDIKVIKERLKLAGEDMPIDKQLSYPSGVLAVSIENVNGISRYQRIRVTHDNNPHAIYLSDRSKGRRLVIGESCDYMAGQIDLTSVRIEIVTGSDDDGHSLKSISDVVLGGQQLLREAYYEPYTYQIGIGDNAPTVTLSARYFPIPNFQVDPKEDLRNGGLMEVNLYRAVDVEAADSSGLSDPYVSFYINDEKEKIYKSKTKKETLNPVWNERFQFEVTKISELTLKALVFDWDMGNRDDALGGAAFDCSELVPLELKSFKAPLTDKVQKGKHEKRKAKERSGYIELSLRYIPGLPPPEKRLGLGGLVGGGAGKVVGGVAGVGIGAVGAGVGAASKGGSKVLGLFGRGKDDEEDEEGDSSKESFAVTVESVVGLDNVKEIQVRGYLVDDDGTEKEIYRSKNIKVDAGQAELTDGGFNFEATPDEALGIKVREVKRLGHSDLGQGTAELEQGSQEVNLGKCTAKVQISKV